MIKKLRVTVDGKPYEVTVEVPDEAEGAGPVAPLAAPAGASAPASAPSPPIAPSNPASTAPKSGSDSGSVHSPLAGRVIAIVAKAGQEVKENDHLLTLEAMKMNTFVFAPKAGMIREINVAVGDAVEEGRLLAQIE